MELISPILRSHEDEGEDHFSWIMKKVWATIAHNFDIDSNMSCDTHIHIRPVDGFTFEKVKSLCKGILYYKEALMTVVQ